MGISGSYDGEGPNVLGQNYSTGQVGPVAPSPDLGMQTNAQNNNKNGGQGREGLMRVDRRGRLRTSDEPARSSTALSIGGGDQVLPFYARYFYCSTTGNLVCRLTDDTADATFTGMVAGATYPISIAIVRAAGTTVTGVLLF